MFSPMSIPTGKIRLNLIEELNLIKKNPINFDKNFIKSNLVFELFNKFQSNFLAELPRALYNIAVGGVNLKKNSKIYSWTSIGNNKKILLFLFIQVFNCKSIEDKRTI